MPVTPEIPSHKVILHGVWLEPLGSVPRMLCLWHANIHKDGFESTNIHAAIER